MIFKHENYVIDLNDASKAKLYCNNQLLFIGDGYKAIPDYAAAAEYLRSAVIPALENLTLDEGEPLSPYMEPSRAEDSGPDHSVTKTGTSES